MILSIRRELGLFETHLVKCNFRCSFLRDLFAESFVAVELPCWEERQRANRECDFERDWVLLVIDLCDLIGVIILLL